MVVLVDDWTAVVMLAVDSTSTVEVLAVDWTVIVGSTIVVL